MDIVTDFESLKEQFLLDNPDYYNDIGNFVKYVRNVRKLKSPEQQVYMVNGITTEEVIASLQYYIDKGQIKKQEPAKKYFVAIKQLFEYVLSNSSYKNDNFLRELANPSTREDSYSRKTNIFVADCSMLYPKESFVRLADHLVSDLISWCDKVIPKEGIFSDNIDATDFRRIVAALCIKLTILAGITYRQSRQIKFCSLNASKNTIAINGFNIRLPLELSVQFQRYAKYRINHLPGEYLFVDPDGCQWGDATSDSGIPNFMKTVIGATNITGIVKYGLIQLIKSGVNDSMIMKLTGASRELLNNCLEDVQGDIDNMDPYWDQYINSKLVTTQSYYKL